MEKKDLLYEGKAKRVYCTDDSEKLIVSYKDDATAFNGLKKGSIAGKGLVNNRMSNLLMSRLEQAGIPTHFIEELNERETLVRRVSIVPLEVVVRNISAGSFSRLYGVEEGIRFAKPVIEFCYKNDALKDPLICSSAAEALGLASDEEIMSIKSYAQRVNIWLQQFWNKRGVTLVDFKLEFGRTADGLLILADEISPDTCRLWDSSTQEKLDKDRFRRDLGKVEEAYQEIMRRVLETF